MTASDVERLANDGGARHGERGRQRWQFRAAQRAVHPLERERVGHVARIVGSAGQEHAIRGGCRGGVRERLWQRGRDAPG